MRLPFKTKIFSQVREVSSGFSTCVQLWWAKIERAKWFLYQRSPKHKRTMAIIAFASH